jgi:hypothetical protein
VALAAWLRLAKQSDKVPVCMFEVKIRQDYRPGDPDIDNRICYVVIDADHQKWVVDYLKGN